MTREQLAALDPNKVRKDKALFALFKKYIAEDNNGVLPKGCLGCSFSKHFSKWRGNYLTPKKQKKMSNSTGRTYELKDANYRVYFKGKVLGRKSTDAEWADWINHPESEDKRKKRVDRFSVLPADSGDKKAETKSTPKKVQAKKTAPKKADSADKPITEDAISEEKAADKAAKQAEKPADSGDKKAETNE